ncbi:MAG: BON domain-containing protein [Blastocatellia bacterium]
MMMIPSDRGRYEQPDFQSPYYRQMDWRAGDMRIQNHLQSLLQQVCEILRENGEAAECRISAQVNHGQVTLQGMAACLKVKRLAENIAHSVSGVSGVRNEIELSAPVPARAAG